MKIIIAGGRDFIPQPHHTQWLDALLQHQAAKNDPITEVITGGAPGADEFGYEWAIKHNIPAPRIKAKWTTYGRAAGPIRNGVMADILAKANRETGEAVAVVLFAGGRGTQSMYDEATKRELRVIDWRKRVE